MATYTYTVTVASGNLYGGGTGNVFYLDGARNATGPGTVNWVEGGTLRFEQSNASNDNHPLIFSTTTSRDQYLTSGVTYYLDGASNYLSYVNTTNFNAATTRYVEVTPSSETDFYYLCYVHGIGMGGIFDITQDTWGALSWDTGAWGAQNTVAQQISGIQISASPGTVGVAEGAGNDVSITGLSIPIDLNLGNGWGREEWGSGAWGTALGDVITGNGNVFIEDGQSVTASINNALVDGEALFTISGMQSNVSAGNFIFQGQVLIPITGSSAATSIGTYTIAAGGAITVNVPEFTINTGIGNINTGTANTLILEGQSLSSNLGTITFQFGNFISITGQNVNATINSITISSEQYLLMTGQQITGNLSNVILDTNNLIIQTGQEISVTPVDLRFWDPIVDDNTEIWTDI